MKITASDLQEIESIVDNAIKEVSLMTDEQLFLSEIEHNLRTIRYEIKYLKQYAKEQNMQEALNRALIKECNG